MAIYGIGNNGTTGINRPTTQFPVRDNTRTPAQPSNLPAPATVTRAPANAHPSKGG